MTIPILAGVMLAAVFSIMVLQWQFRKRRTAGEDKALKKGEGRSVAAAKERSGEIYEVVDEQQLLAHD